MTKNKHHKRLVRERMAKTGESYQSAKRAVEPRAVPDTDTPERWALRVGTGGVTPNVEDRELVFADAPFVIGRNDSSTFKLDHPLVSRKHATLRATAEAVTIEDHESRNGTFHNGARISGVVQLSLGDRIKIADTELTLVRTRRAAPLPEIGSKACPPELGSVLAGRYRLERVIPTSGLGAEDARASWVRYKATHVLLGAPMMITLLPSATAREQQDLRSCLLREGRALQRASHPQVQRVFDIVETGTQDVFLVLDMVPDQTLTDLLAAEGPNEAMALDVGVQLADVLTRVHANGVVHRNLRNDVIHMEPGARPRVKLTSFSMAAVADEPSLPPAGSSWTTAWAAPELRRGETGDARSDLYAVGVILSTLLTGKLPSATTALPSPLGAICKKLLAADPEDRYASAAALAEDLARVGTGLRV